MVDILIRQNEKRNLALLRKQDILVKPQLTDIGFADFNRAAEIAKRGQVAVASVEDRWSVLRSVKRQAQDAPALHRLSFDQREKHIVAIEAQGQEDVSASYIQSVMAPLVNQEFTPAETERYIDELYTSGFFDLVSYSLQQQQGHYVHSLVSL